MATYDELFDLRSNSSLRNRVAVAAVKKAQALLDGTTPTTDQVTWANSVLTSPMVMASKLLLYVLGANSSATVVVITGASDASIQTNVDAAADALIAAGVV